jgi:hypothetical protein
MALDDAGCWRSDMGRPSLVKILPDERAFVETDLSVLEVATCRFGLGFAIVGCSAREFPMNGRSLDVFSVCGTCHCQGLSVARGLHHGVEIVVGLGVAFDMILLCVCI